MRDNEVRSTRIFEEEIWDNAVHRVATDGITPEQAVDEALARIKQILADSRRSHSAPLCRGGGIEHFGRDTEPGRADAGSS